MRTKRKIFVALIAIVLTVLVLSAILFKNIFWFERMIVNRTLAEKYPNTKISISTRIDNYKRLFIKGQNTAKLLNRANSIWKSSDSIPQDYQKAAETILVDMELNKNEWLTLGNVIKYFGVPEDVDGLFPIKDEDGKLLVALDNYSVYYKDRNIRFDFSLSGYLESVMLVTHDGKGATGISKLYWPHDYTYAKSFPIYTGFKYDINTNRFFLAKMKEMVKAAIHNNEFFRNIEALTPQEKSLIHIDNMRIYMIDGINKDLAKVYFEFSTKDITVCYSRWFNKIDGQWFPSTKKSTIKNNMGQSEIADL